MNSMQLIFAIVLGLSFTKITEARNRSSSGRPQSKLAQDAQAFPTMDRAAIAALRRSVARSTEFEFGGCIVKYQGNFFFTEPVGNGSRDAVNIECLIPTTTQLVAIYHTHPDGTAEPGFSAHDVRVAKAMGKVSYVGGVDDNAIIKFIPGVTRVSCPHSFRSCGVSGRYSEGTYIAPLR